MLIIYLQVYLQDPAGDLYPEPPHTEPEPPREHRGTIVIRWPSTGEH